MLITRQQELMSALVQSMNMPVPDVGTVIPKPTAPMPTGASWDLKSDPDVTRMQADLEAVKDVKAAEEAEKQ